jgi:hypothetical protein
MTKTAFSVGGDGGRRSPELHAPPTTANKEKAPGSEAGARLGLCVTEVTVTNRTVKNTHFLHNRAISEIRLL